MIDSNLFPNTCVCHGINWILVNLIKSLKMASNQINNSEDDQIIQEQEEDMP